ncbi:substrate-binding domain-containing protein, partial [Enterocloster lavalensis]
NTRLEEDAIQAFMRSQVDGIIYLGNTVGDEIAEGLKRTHVPVVFAMTQYPDKYFSSVTIDNEAAAYHAVTYLCGRGHRRICLLAGEADDPNSGIPRTEGYCRALGKQGIPVDPTLIVCGGYRLERGYEDMKRLLGERRDFTAVFAVSDDVAIGAMRAVQEAGLRVPEDLSIVGFDGIEMAEYTFPGLTTVSQPFEKIGEEASRLLVSRMKDGKRGGNLVLPFALQERESVLGLAGETLP